MVTVVAPWVAVGLAVSVSVLLRVAGLGLNDAVTPRGRLDAASVTPASPLEPVTVTVLTAVAPGAMVRLLGFAESEKPSTPFTVSGSVTVLASVPLVPAMVME